MEFLLVGGNPAQSCQESCVTLPARLQARKHLEPAPQHEDRDQRRFVWLQRAHAMVAAHKRRDPAKIVVQRVLGWTAAAPQGKGEVGRSRFAVGQREINETTGARWPSSNEHVVTRRISVDDAATCGSVRGYIELVMKLLYEFLYAAGGGPAIRQGQCPRALVCATDLF